MTQTDAIKYWVTSTEHDVRAAKDMYETGHYDWCLFLWHLVIEKSLKAVISSQAKTPVPVHNLVKLAEQAEMELGEEKLKILKEITTFNLEARYDDYKLSFYQKATKEYAKKWQDICEDLYKEFIHLCR